MNTYRKKIEKGLTFSSCFVTMTLVLSLISVTLFEVELTTFYFATVVLLCLGHYLISGPLAVVILKKA